MIDYPRRADLSKKGGVMACITHHEACDCREARWAKIEKKYEVLKKAILDISRLPADEKFVLAICEITEETFDKIKYIGDH